MLLDALRSELWRFSKHTTVWVWALIVVPVGSAIVGIFYRQFLYGQISKAGASLPPEISITPDQPIILGRILLEQTMQSAGINLLALFLIAAAMIAAADYRWESWRLIRPRNTRRNLILGKALGIAAIAIIPLLLFIFFEMFGQIITASMENRRITIGLDLEKTLAGLLMLVVAWLRAIQVGMLAILAAVATRSLFGGYVIAVAFSAGTFLIQRMLMGFGWMPEELRTLLLFPAAAHETMQNYLAQGPQTFTSFWISLLGLLLWIGVPLTLAILLFERQDLSKE